MQANVRLSCSRMACRSRCACVAWRPRRIFFSEYGTVPFLVLFFWDPASQLQDLYRVSIILEL
jgi:hypothetical protein